MDDAWEVGDSVERFMGRWSRLTASAFLAWLAAPSGLRWLDIGRGTGTLSRLIADTRRPKRVSGIDSAPGFIEHAEAVHSGRPIDFHVAGADDLPFAGEQFDCIVSGLALNFFPDPAAALAEMTRVARPGAVIAVDVWDYAGEMQMLRRF